MQHSNFNSVFSVDVFVNAKIQVINFGKPVEREVVIEFF